MGGISRSWRDLEITDKQKDVLLRFMKNGAPLFIGLTRGDAADYITVNESFFKSVYRRSDYLHYDARASQEVDESPGRGVVF